MYLFRVNTFTPIEKCAIIWQGRSFWLDKKYKKYKKYKTVQDVIAHWLVSDHLL